MLTFQKQSQKPNYGRFLPPVAEAEMDVIILLCKGISYTLTVRPERTQTCMHDPAQESKALICIPWISKNLLLLKGDNLPASSKAD